MADITAQQIIYFCVFMAAGMGYTMLLALVMLGTLLTTSRKVRHEYGISDGFIRSAKCFILGLAIMAILFILAAMLMPYWF